MDTVTVVNIFRAKNAIMLHMVFHPHSEQFMEFDEDNSGDIGMC